MATSDDNATVVAAEPKQPVDGASHLRAAASVRKVIE
jgi:hypothetical protein